MNLKSLNSDLLPLKYPSNFNPWNNPEFSGRILFIGGIHRECNQEEIFKFLKSFDDVLWIKIEVEQGTGQGRGHAYAIVASKEGQAKILLQTKHKIMGLQIGISVWKSSKEYLSEKDMAMKRKVFVKRLSPNCREQEVADYFSTFGRVEKAEIRRNHADNSSRKIAFVIFENEKSATDCLNCKIHFIKGKEILVKRCRNPTEVKKDRNMTYDGFESERHNSFSYSEESMLSHKDWSFFTVPLNSSSNILNSSFSLKENDDYPSLNVSSSSFFVNNVSKLTNNSFNETWIKGVVPIQEEDETADTNFPPNMCLTPVTPTCQIEAKEDSLDSFFIEPLYKIEVTITFFTFPGYV